jgi:hypothetical protein
VRRRRSQVLGVRSQEIHCHPAVEEAKLGAWDFYGAPDGKALDYVSAEHEWTDVWEKPFAGGEPRRITHFGSGEVSDFRWSRDGKRVLVVWGPTIDDVVLLSGLQEQ